MNIDELIQKLENIAPIELAEDYDNGRIGHVIEGKNDINTIACALDLTPYVATKAAELNVDALIVHHPPFWNPMHGVFGRNVDLIRPLLVNNINLYVMHTNYDHADGGINDILATELKLKNIRKGSLEIVGDLTIPLPEISKILGCDLRVWGDVSKIKRLAVAGGSAFDLELIFEAYNLGADAYLSSELKHNVYLESPIPCIEATHYSLESIGMKSLAKRENWVYIDDSPIMSWIQQSL